MAACNSGGALKRFPAMRTAFFNSACSATAAAQWEHPGRWAVISCCAAGSSSSSIYNVIFCRHLQLMILHLQFALRPQSPKYVAVPALGHGLGATSQSQSEYPECPQLPGISSLQYRPATGPPENGPATWR